MDVEGWQRFEYRDMEEGTSPPEKNVSKDVEIRNSREAANSSFLVSRMHEKDERERELASLTGAR